MNFSLKFQVMQLVEKVRILRSYKLLIAHGLKWVMLHSKDSLQEGLGLDLGERYR